jgi:uncharacterized protein involved in exopolysaccharide biosynthesis
MNSQPDFDFFEKEESINYKEIIGKYLPYWPWFILSVLLAYGAASLFLRYTPVIYKTEAKVKIDSCLMANIPLAPARFGISTFIFCSNIFL